MMIPSFLLSQKSETCSVISLSALALRESRLLVLYKMQIVLQKTIPLFSLSAKTGFGLAPNADRLAKNHSPVLTFRESRFLALFQMQIVL
jgi:hypothetical protein